MSYSHEKEGVELMIEMVENQVSALKQEIEEMKKTNKEKLDIVRVEARANSKQLAQLINTVV